MKSRAENHYSNSVRRSASQLWCLCNSCSSDCALCFPRLGQGGGYERRVSFSSLDKRDQCRTNGFSCRDTSAMRGPTRTDNPHLEAVCWSAPTDLSPDSEHQLSAFCATLGPMYPRDNIPEFFSETHDSPSCFMAI